MVDATLAPSAAAAQQILRDSSQFQWYVIPLMVVVIYLYSEQWHARRWSVILGGLAFWLMDWVNEIWNGLVLHFSGYAPVWGAPSDTAFLILAGLNIEISLMFAVLGLAAMLTLPRDPKAKILGVNNRVVWAATNAALSVLVEIYLNHIGALVWEWPFWNASSPWLIFLLGYLPFYLVGAWVHDMPSRRRQVVAVSGLGTFVAASLILFVPVLGWLQGTGMRKAGIGLCVLLLLASCGGGNTSNATRTAAPFELGPEAPFTERVDHHADLPSCVLLAGTMGIPDPVSLDVLPDIGSGLLGVVSPEVPEGFPERVHLRSDTATFNRKYQFYLHEGRVWYKKNAAVEEAGPWLAVPMPACLAGTLIGISADDDELIAIRENGDIYGLDNILKDPLLFNWTSRWGAPVWLGTGYYIQEDYLSWSWTVISNSEDKNWRDPAGNLHRVGDGKVSHIWMLRDNGQRYTFIDPWLPKDESYEACGPLRGRFKGVNLNSSGSTLVTVNRYGDIYTRHYDFDLAGDNEVFFQYAFEDQRGVANPKIQLPSFPWVQQPKVPGEITHLISIHKLGINMAQRLIRVEGRDAKGNVGYWEKAVAAESVADWQFYPTGGHLRGTLLDNSPKDTSQRDLGESEDRYYQRNMASVATLAPERDLRDDMDWAAELSDFNLYCSPTTLRVYTGPEESMDLTLHVVDVIRQTPRARGLDDEPRSFRGNIEVPEALRNQKAALSARQRQFLTLYLEDKAFTDVRMSGVPSRITITKSALSGGFEWQFEQP